MRYYIEACRADGSPILGNLDGQAALGEPRYPERTAAWRYLYSPERPTWTRVYLWKLVDATGRVIRERPNSRFSNPKESHK